MRKIISGLLACLIIACYVLTRASELELKATVPDHVGYTLKRSPVIYYFISKPTSLPTRFTLRDLRRMRNELLGIHLLEVSFMQKSSLSPFHVSSTAFCLPEFLCKGRRFRAYTVVVVPALRGSALRTLRSHVWLRERIGNTFFSPRRQKWYLPGGPPQI